MSNPVPRPGIMGIDPYVGGESSLDGREKVIKLSSNERKAETAPESPFASIGSVICQSFMPERFNAIVFFPQNQ